jgi:hypothetical protein
MSRKTTLLNITTRADGELKQCKLPDIMSTIIIKTAAAAG